MAKATAPDPASRAGASRRRWDRWRLLGTFLIAFALLSFEITTVRTINFVLGPSHIYAAIALALLGLSAAGSLLSLVDPARLERHRDRIFWLSCLGIAALLVASSFMAVDVKEALNAAIEAAGRAGGRDGAVGTFFTNGLFASIRIGVVLSMPYFLFGGLLSYLFTTSDGETYGAYYGADLLGAAAGSITAVVFMEATSYAFSVTAPAVAALLAAAAFAAPWSRAGAAGSLAGAIVLGAVSGAGWYVRGIEPVADPNFQVRDYEYRRDLVEIWHAWNGFTRVGAVRETQAPGEPVILSLGNGEGMAWLIPYTADRESPLRHPPTVPALLFDEAPESALVMFAGVGADLMSLRENGVGRVIGVEINQTLVDGAMALPEFGLSRFLADESVALEVSEGRGFLERDDRRYDMILLSWSGATAAYYAGMLSGTEQYLFTYEGLASILDHLTPDGHSVILQVNKVKMLATLRRYLRERGGADPGQTAIVLFSPSEYVRAWDGQFDNNPLLIKPSGWSDEEVSTIRRNAAREGFDIAYAPGLGAHPSYTAYRRILEAPDWEAELATLGSETGQRFEIATDDRPFIFDLFDNGRYLRPEFWTMTGMRPYEVTHLVRVVFVGIVTAVAVLLILGPLLLAGGPSMGRRTLSHLGYFACLGAGFIVVEIGLIQKAGLLFDTPSTTIAVVLASLILCTGIGSLMSDWSFRRGLTYRAAALGVCLYTLLLFFALEFVVQTVISWPLFLRGILVAGLIAPGAVLMGHLFPQGLVLAAKDERAIVPWAWGVNGATSTIGAGIAPLAAQVWGSSGLFLAGAALYGAILILPTTRGRSSGDSAPGP
ncbi:MAG TPA: hypothetical protein VLA43_03630 [Longimicrobiales bacterium]|nr:hypothetical protein [Longimicrobiales bacterium]